MSSPPSASSAPSENTGERGLFLRVQGAANELRTVPLGAGLSIGSDSCNSIVIDHPEVAFIHATIDRDGEELLLECAAGAVVTLSDGRELSRLTLLEGTRCRIGDVVLTCERAGVEPVGGHETHCARCGAGLAHLPQTRRFCPRCGLILATAAGPSPAPVADRPPLSVLRVVEKSEPNPSVIIEGYATAMNKLGVRYEAGLGVARNEDEAIRCYGKAARLGNEDAMIRLRQWDGAPEPAEPPHNPPHPSA